VSEYDLDEDGEVISGRRAFSTVYTENTLVGPAADTSPASRRRTASLCRTRAGRRQSSASRTAPTTPDSQLYLYVGQKQSFGTGLHRNGLDNGRLYVFAAESGPATEAVNGAPRSRSDRPG
jgi:hypothetical protein